MQRVTMKKPTFLYHADCRKGKIFDASDEGFAELLENGWCDNPGLEESKSVAVASPLSMHGVTDETIIARVNELAAWESRLDGKEQELAAKQQSIDEAMEVLENEKAAFMSLISEHGNSIDPAVANLAQRFVADPTELTVQELYTYGKAIGASVHHRHSEEKLIEVIAEHMSNDRS